MGFSGTVVIYGRCNPKINTDHMLTLVKNATMALLGFDEEDRLDYSVMLVFSNAVCTPGFFSCEAEVSCESFFDVDAYAKRLEDWLSSQLRSSAYGTDGISVFVKDPTASTSTTEPGFAASSLKSQYKPGKCIHVVSDVFEGKTYSEELKQDLHTLIQSFLESESKGTYDTFYGGMVPDKAKSNKEVYALHLVVACKNLGGSDDACAQRVWAMCQRLEEWLDVQLYAKHPDYRRTVCVLLRNELKPSVF